MLKSLKVKNFRNHAEFESEFFDGINAITGANAVGKSSILEAIAYFGIGKSFRSVKPVELIRDGEESVYISAQIDDHILESIWDVEGNKNIKLDGKRTTLKKFLMLLPVVIFTPDDLLMLTLEPRRRRKFFDGLTVKIELGLIGEFKKYNESLRSRNVLLKENGTSEELDYYENILAKINSVVWKKRVELVEEINEIFGDIRMQLPDNSELFLDYNAGERSLEAEDIARELRESRAKDRIVGRTTVGIHTDDWELKLGGNPLSTHGSRGEMRTGILALKYAETVILENHRGQKPLILLDDIFQELDVSRESLMGQLFARHQTVLTSVYAPKVELAQEIKL